MGRGLVNSVPCVRQRLFSLYGIGSGLPFDDPIKGSTREGGRGLHPPLPLMRAHAPLILCSGFTYIIVNKKTKLVLDDPVGDGGSVTVNRLSENDTQKVLRSPPQLHPLTPSLYPSGYSLRTAMVFGLSRTSGMASSFASRNSTRRTETLLSQKTATHRCAVGPSSLKTA